MRYEDERAIMPHLLPSESLTWTGRPATGLIFRSSDMILIPFSLAWCGFACFWEFSVFRMGAPLFFILFGALFVVFGLHLVFGRFVYDVLRRRKTIYALTGERILRLTGKTLSAWNLKHLPPASLVASSDRRGTIMFGEVYVPGLPVGGRLRPVRGVWTLPVLEKIENAGDVYGMVQAAQGRASESRPEESAWTRERRDF